MIGAVPRTAAQLLLKASIHERGENQQHHRDCDLSADQEITPPTSPSSYSRLAALHDHRQVRARRLNRRSDTEQDRAQHGDEETEHQRPAIELEGECHRQIGRDLNQLKQFDGTVANRKTQHAAGERDQQTLHHQLPNQPGSPGPDRQAHGHLARACRRPAGQQPGDVGAGDEQHRGSERGQHGNQRRVGRRLRDSRLQLRTNDQTAIAVRVWIRPLEILRDDGQLCLRARHAHARFEAPLDCDVAEVAVL